MILQQYNELLKLRNVEMKHGKALADIIKMSGGEPNSKERHTITENAMFHFIREIEKKDEEIKVLNSKLNFLETQTHEYDLVEYIKFIANQIARYEVNECDGSYVGTEHKTSFVYDCTYYDMTLNVFWETQNHIEINVKSDDIADYEFSEIIYF